MPISKADRVMFEKVRQGDLEVRERAILKNLRLAYSIALSFHPPDQFIEDVKQEAARGLIVAVDRYDPRREVLFISYATPVISGAIKRHFRDHAWFVHPPRKVKDLVSKIRAARETLSQDFQREPTLADIASLLNQPLDVIIQASSTDSMKMPFSTAFPVGENEKGEPLFLEDVLAADDPAIADFESRGLPDEILTAFKTLDGRSQRVIKLRFYHGLSQETCGKIIGCSQMNIHRIEFKALNQMRSVLQELGITSSRQLCSV